MANILLTNLCNLKCSYCFAAPFLSDPGNNQQFLSLETFEKYLDFSDRSGLQQVRLMGGEPTLHPDFEKFVLLAQQRGKHVVVFTNGLMPSKALQALLDLPVSECSALVNITPLDDKVYSGDQSWNVGAQGKAAQLKAERLSKTLSRLGLRAQLGYTIFQHGQLDLSWIVEIIDRAGCCRSIRLGMAQPAKNGNSFVHPKKYQQIGKQVAEFTQKAAKEGVTVELDCGFVRCMFSEEDMQTLKQSQAHIAWRCSPVLDFDWNGSAFPCFPLAEITRIEDGLSQTTQALRAQFEKTLSYFRVCGIFPECSSCGLRITEKCSGGCLASTLRRMKDQAIRYQIPARYAAEFFQYHEGTSH